MTTIDASLRALEIQGRPSQAGLRHLGDRGRECQEAVEDALAIGYRHIDTARLRQRARSGRGSPPPESRATSSSSRRRSGARSTRPTTCGRGRGLAAEPAGRRPRSAADALAEPGFPARGDARRARRAARGGADQAPRRLELPGRDAARGAGRRADLRRPGRVPPLPGPGRARGARGREGLHGHRLLAARPRQGPEDETLRKIGEAHGKTAGQVALRWLLDKPQVATIPKASSHERRVENFEVFDFELSDEERARIEALPKASASSTRWAPDWDA